MVSPIDLEPQELIQELIQQLIQFYQDECKASESKRHAIWDMSLPERVNMGEALDQLKMVNASSRKALLSCSENNAKFRVGDWVLLHRLSPEGADRPLQGRPCTIIEDNGTGFIIESRGQAVFHTVDIGTEGWVLDADVFGVHSGVMSSLQELLYKPVYLDMLKGAIQPVFDASKRERTEELLTQLPALNAGQREAFRQAYSTQNFYCIQGPPGTGKTWFLAQLAIVLASQGEIVLITGPTHRAINHALNSIYKTSLEQGMALPIYKVGSLVKCEDLNEGISKETTLSFQLSTGMILGATCFEVSKPEYKNGCDTVFFDEASQLTQHLAIVGMQAGKRSIFVGDHQQMSPIILADHTRHTHNTRPELSMSIFECLTAHSSFTMLKDAYRMHPAIHAIPNQLFYNNELVPQREWADRLLIQRSDPFLEILDPNQPEVLVELAHQEATMTSPTEANLISELIIDLLRKGVAPANIAVIAPYRAQGRLIREAIRLQLEEQSLAPFEAYPSELIVDTVERIQGQEREVIIISLTTSDFSYLTTHDRDDRLGWYFLPNRLNVAITRPIYKRIVIGSRHLFETIQEAIQLGELPEQLIRHLDIFYQFYAMSSKVDLTDFSSGVRFNGLNRGEFMKKKTIYRINGKHCATLQGFFDEITDVLQLAPWEYSLEAFHDVLRGGYGTPKGGFVLYWMHSKYSGHHLGARTFDTLVQIIRVHGERGEEAQDGIELELF